MKITKRSYATGIITLITMPLGTVPQRTTTLKNWKNFVKNTRTIMTTENNLKSDLSDSQKNIRDRPVFLSDIERKAICALLDVAEQANYALEDSCDSGHPEHNEVPKENIKSLNDALDVLDELPDDQPGYIMGPRSKAEWTLRRFVSGTDNNIESSAMERDSARYRYCLEHGFPFSTVLDNPKRTIWLYPAPIDHNCDHFPDPTSAIDAAMKSQPAQPSDSQALFRCLAQDEEPRVKHTCNMGVGCEETGICYADAQGEPERCGKQSSDSQTKVPEDEDDLPIGYVDWYNRYFARQAVDMHRFADCEEAWREAYKAAMRAEREGS